MASEWARRDDHVDDADKHAAATLAAALIIRGANLPGAEDMTGAAAQAVEIYRHVLDSLKSPEAGQARSEGD